MILLVHLILGAAIGSKISNIYLAIILALLSHYLLDIIPHFDYPVKSNDRNQWKKLLLGAVKVALDLLVGISLILIFSKNQPLVYIGAFFALLPDGFTVLKYLIPNNKIFEAHYALHMKLHFLKDKKISMFWRILNQVIVVIISIIILKY
jgi:hypothetical protein